MKELYMDIPWWGLLPFVVMLGTIAVAPLIPATHHAWERNSVKLAVALLLGVPVAIWIWFGVDHHLVLHSLEEYAQFIALLFSLYVVSGGLFVAGDIQATPRNNTIILAIGGALASFIGTTGAAMLLIRPLLNINREREYKVHTVVFAILLVANCGGLLTPLGDPPLYIGLMRGVPFAWTFSMWAEWLFIGTLLLLTYYGQERLYYSKESEFAIAWEEASSPPLSLHGKLNIVWFAVIIGSVALLGDYTWLKIGVQLGAAAASYFIGDRAIRVQDNEFTWHPIAEVAVLFVGIFLTMIPALEFLRAHAGQLPLNEYTLFGFTGALSSMLDNAPTYLTFFEMSTQLTLPGEPLVAGVPQLYLTAVSLGAVTCGALTYIGNGPNFMVKSVAEERGVKMPSFGGYIGWALRYLAPILVAMVLIFLSANPLLLILGIGLAALIAGDAIRLAVAHPLPQLAKDEPDPLTVV
ncbi:MAG: sodium:proton antiporter [Propionibacteriaceae bacterium]|jgi:Na+/H+ antiporter NhaD/arsenite permease-like protein|nr:sodium:proton antiporter [Propionibacteriaceae bacterium]